MTLVAERVAFSHGDQEVLQDVSFAVNPGEVVGLIGPNGAGKSTLLQALAGLLGKSKMNVRVDGKLLTDMSTRERARTIAYLLQKAAVHWPLAVEQVVALGRHPHGGAKPGDASVQTAMSRMNVLDLSNQPMSALSAGEQMRVHISRALAVEAPYLLADEPVAALDPYHQLECMELLHRESRAGRGVAVVLHDLLLAARFCDRLVLLHRGKVAAEGTPQEVLRSEALQEAYAIEVVQLQHDSERFVLPWRRRLTFREEKP